MYPRRKLGQAQRMSKKLLRLISEPKALPMQWLLAQTEAQIPGLRVGPLRVAHLQDEVPFASNCLTERHGIVTLASARARPEEFYEDCACFRPGVARYFPISSKCDQRSRSRSRQVDRAGECLEPGPTTSRCRCGGAASPGDVCLHGLRWNGDEQGQVSG